MPKRLLNKNDRIDVEGIINNLYENMGYSQDEAKRFCKATLLERFKKNFFPALDYLQNEQRYKKVYFDLLYPDSGRWYTDLYKREISEKIKFNTIIKISTAYEVSPGELIDFIIGFDKKKK